MVLFRVLPALDLPLPFEFGFMCVICTATSSELPANRSCCCGWWNDVLIPELLPRLAPGAFDLCWWSWCLLPINLLNVCAALPRNDCMADWSTELSCLCRSSCSQQQANMHPVHKTHINTHKTIKTICPLVSVVNLFSKMYLNKDEHALSKC